MPPTCCSGLITVSISNISKHPPEKDDESCKENNTDNRVDDDNINLVYELDDILIHEYKLSSRNEHTGRSRKSRRRRSSIVEVEASNQDIY